MIVNELGGAPVVAKGVYDGFEFMSPGLVTGTNFDKFILREKTPRKRPDGNVWERAYAFGDGHVEVFASTNGNFDETEHSFTVQPGSQ